MEKVLSVLCVRSKRVKKAPEKYDNNSGVKGANKFALTTATNSAERANINRQSPIYL